MPSNEIRLHCHHIRPFMDCDPAAIYPVLPIWPVKAVSITQYWPHYKAINIKIIFLLAKFKPKPIKIISRVTKLVSRN